MPRVSPGEASFQGCARDPRAMPVAVPDPVARRLADAVCRMVAEGHDGRRIRRALSRRARSMLPGGEVAEIDLEDVPFVGAAEAPRSR